MRTDAGERSPLAIGDRVWQHPPNHMIRWFEHRQVYMPSREWEVRPDGRPFEDIYFDTRDGVRLNGWFYGAEAGSTRSHLVVVLFHGNAGNISHRSGMYGALLELGLNVFAVDYRGYGRSEGRPGEAGTYLDAEAAYDWVRVRGFEAAHIVVHGNSLGGGVASELALRRETGGLILQNSFCSVPEIGRDIFPFLPVRLLASIKYDTRSKLPQVGVPVMIMHSPIDEIIPFRHGKENFSVAKHPKLFWELAGGHNDTLVVGRDRFLEGMNLFLNQHLNKL